MKTLFIHIGRSARNAKMSTDSVSPKSSELLLNGILHGGEEVKPGTLHSGEEVKPGTLHSIGEQLIGGTLCATYSPATYRTKDGKAYYRFRYVDIGGKFEIDILEQPSYRNRDSSAHITHRLPSSRGGRKICVTAGCEPTTIGAAHSLSKQWAELTHEYIKSGTTIDAQVEYNSLPWWKKMFY